MSVRAARVIMVERVLTLLVDSVVNVHLNGPVTYAKSVSRNAFIEHWTFC